MADAIETQTRQVTSETPATKPKNPKRVAAGKATAEKTRQAREAQKKAAEEAAAIISANKAKDTPALAPPQPQPTDNTACSEAAASSSKAAISTPQWLAIGSFVVSLIGLYYKREEIKSALSLQKSEAKRLRASGATPETTGITPVAQQQESVTYHQRFLCLRSKT